MTTAARPLFPLPKWVLRCCSANGHHPSFAIGHLPFYVWWDASRENTGGVGYLVQLQIRPEGTRLQIVPGAL
jgi:hypothetical protein